MDFSLSVNFLLLLNISNSFFENNWQGVLQIYRSFSLTENWNMDPHGWWSWFFSLAKLLANWRFAFITFLSEFLSFLRGRCELTNTTRNALKHKLQKREFGRDSHSVRGNTRDAFKRTTRSDVLHYLKFRHLFEGVAELAVHNSCLNRWTSLAEFKIWTLNQGRELQFQIVVDSSLRQLNYELTPTRPRSALF